MVHVVASAGWLGLDGALVALEVTGLHSGDPAVRAGIALAMAVIAGWVLIPAVFVSLCSGLVLALGTSWGLTRHWWLVTKSAIAVVLTATGATLMLPRLPEIVAGDGAPAQGLTLAARSVALGLLFTATGLSVVKPWGKTGLARSRGTQPTAAAQGTGLAPATLWSGRTDALDDIGQEGPRSAQLHALRGLRAFPGAPGGRVLVRGSRTWVDTTALTDAASVARPQGQPAARSRRPPRRGRSLSRARSIEPPRGALPIVCTPSPESQHRYTAC